MEKFIVLITTGLDESIRVFETEANDIEELDYQICSEINNFEHYQVIPKNEHNLKEANKLVHCLRN